DVQRPRRAGDGSTAYRAQMVGVDLQPHRGETILATEHCAGGAQRFRQRHRGAAMQDAVGLERARVHRHRAAQEILADFGDADADRTHHRVLAPAIDGVEAVLLFPDGHGSPGWIRSSTPALPKSSRHCAASARMPRMEYTVTLAASGKSFDVREGETVLEAAQRAG